MRVFLDSSVLLAACGSERGASREIVQAASANNTTLLASHYVIEEVLRNLTRFDAAATAQWARFRPTLLLVDDVLTIDRAAVFEPSKDRPILFTALAWSEALLTLDRTDFGTLIGSTFYGLTIQTPAMFLEQQRKLGRWPKSRA
jgi:predicted nucleic acid-binding protein